ncbi:sensor histidine kinase DesK [mine drainage metagenome]|uniref:histidine kinase n=1 Tax=mine drainage metagenome TaxID=410659 RepID=A0A1J5RV76_9ZZZZ
MQWWERASRWSEAHRFPIDAVGTALLLLATVVVSTPIQGGSPSAARLWTVALVVPLAWRRSRPVASVVAVYAVGLLQVVLGTPLVVPTDLVVLVALYSVTVYGPRWAYRTAIVSALVGAWVLGLALVVDASLGSLASAAFIAMLTGTSALAAWAFGLVRRSRRETIGALVDRAERLEVERDQQGRIATAAERSRIAREMHDIVAHSLSVIIAQSDGGRYAAETDPAAAVRSLATIGETGRAALADMRRLLGVLRSDDDPGAGTPGPQPAVEDIDALVDQVRTSGLRVSLVRMGSPRIMPPGAGLTAYRICQEALTNVLKHAGPDPQVTVVVQWLPTSLVLDVSDDGRGAAVENDGAGKGLLGMRERAAMFRGSLTAGPRAGGGFRVRAEIPLPPSPAPVGDDRPDLLNEAR